MNNALKGLIVVALAGLGGIGIPRDAGRAAGGQPPGPPPAESPASRPRPVRPELTNRPATPANPEIPGGVMTPENPTASQPVTTNNWEDKLEEILVSDTEDTNKLKQLFEMFPQLPEEGQVEVAQHLSNLVEDS